MNQWLQELGLREGALIGGSIGALVSLKFVPGRTWWQRLSSAAGGALVAAYLTPLVLNFFRFDGSLEYGVAFLVGMFGLTIVAALMEAVPRAVQSTIDKFTR